MEESLTAEEVEELKRQKKNQYQRAWRARQGPGYATENARRYWYRQFLDDLHTAEHARDEESLEILRERGII